MAETIGGQEKKIEVQNRSLSRKQSQKDNISVKEKTKQELSWKCQTPTSSSQTSPARSSSNISNNDKPPREFKLSFDAPVFIPSWERSSMSEWTLEELALNVVFKDSVEPGWVPIINDPWHRSFASYLKNPFDQKTLKRWFKLAEKRLNWVQPRLPGGDALLPRKAVWLCQDGCTCTYRYGATEWPCHKFPRWFRKMTKAVVDKMGIPLTPPNCCNANLYWGADSRIGWHADDRPIIQSKIRDTMIMSLSLMENESETRAFHVKPVGMDNAVTSTDLGHGDLMTMEGLFQKHYLHRLPPHTGPSGKRINFTWRWIVEHDETSCIKRERQN